MSEDSIHRTIEILILYDSELIQIAGFLIVKITISTEQKRGRALWTPAASSQVPSTKILKGKIKSIHLA